MSDSKGSCGDQVAAWLLHYKPIYESSYVLHAFTLDCGRLSLMARGARATKPATRVLYQPFRPLRLSWRGQTEMPRLTAIEDSGQPVALNDDAAACGWYMNELLLRLIGRGQIVPELFAAYGQSLEALSQHQPMATVLRRFELNLLDAIGQRPDFARCVAGGQVPVSGVAYDFYPGAAVAVAVGDGEQTLPPPPDPLGQVAPLGWLADGLTPDEPVRLDGACLMALASGGCDLPACAPQCKRLLRALLALQLGDRPLKSRRWFRQKSDTANE